MRFVFLLLIIAMIGVVFYFQPLSPKDKVNELRKQLRGEHCDYEKNCESTPFLRGYGSQECAVMAAECIAKMGEDGVAALPDLMEQIRTRPESYDTGDGGIGVRHSMIKALTPFRERSEVLPFLIEMVTHSNESYSRKAAVDIIVMLGIKARGEEMEIALTASPEGLAGLLAIQSHYAVTRLQEILRDPWKDAEITIDALRLLREYPLVAQELDPELYALFDDVANDERWRQLLQNATSQKSIERIYSVRNLVSENFFYFRDSNRFDLALLKEKLPSQSKKISESWNDLYNQKLFELAEADTDAFSKCRLFNATRNKEKILLPRLEKALANPLDDFAETYAALVLISKDSKWKLKNKPHLLALVSDLADTKRWKDRLQNASTQQEKQKIFFGRVLLSNTSLLEGHSWLTGEHELNLLEKLPSNIIFHGSPSFDSSDLRGVYDEWMAYGKSLGLDDSFRAIPDSCY
jgi:hypothetical protein